MPRKKHETKKTEVADEVYNVERFLGKKLKDGEPEYQVKWEGYPKEESTWEPLWNLEHMHEYISNYENSLSRFLFRKFFSRLKMGIEDPIEDLDAFSRDLQPNSKQIKKLASTEPSKKSRKRLINKAKLKEPELEQEPVKEEKVIEKENGDAKPPVDNKVKDQVKIETNTIDILQVYGDITTDTPESIIKHAKADSLTFKNAEPEAEQLYFKVTWCRRLDGTTPKPSYYALKDLREKAPLLLLDYYVKKAKLDGI
eukprot:TRINITY_DN4823_c0_g1_i6.p1 TRINITY_DN4823_c0_g1~~TRINITY_DN4823_c0_g1_i6.p1  ORF type:complete len:255 (-),score=44.34 TRINITY_DN4823_c0_g1_i6:83-847(-)